MRLYIAAVVLVPALASAQPGATPVSPMPAEPEASMTTSPEVLRLARGAHLAGARGDCVGARALASQVRRLDRDFYDAVILTDLSIIECKSKPRVYAPDPEQPAALKPQPRQHPAGPTPVDKGRNIGGQFLLGSIMGAGLGLLGFAASFSADDEEGTALILSTAGLIAGTTAGVVLAGDNEGSDYSLALTLGGSMLGTALGWKIALDSSIRNPGSAIAVLVLAPTVGAMLGFNGSRRTLYPNATTQLAVPAAPRISDATSVSLLTGNF